MRRLAYPCMVSPERTLVFPYVRHISGGSVSEMRAQADPWGCRPVAPTVKGGSEGVQVVVTSVDLLVAELLLVVICNFASSPDLS